MDKTCNKLKYIFEWKIRIIKKYIKKILKMCAKFSSKKFKTLNDFQKITKDNASIVNYKNYCKKIISSPSLTNYFFTRFFRY